MAPLVLQAKPRPPVVPAAPPPSADLFTPQADESGEDIEDLEDAVGLTTAAQLYRKKDYRGALAELAVFVGTNPESPHLARARFVMAHCLRELRRYEDAASIYADLVRVYPLMADDSLLELGRTRAAIKDHAGAADALARVSVEHPRRAEAQRLLAWELYNAGQHAEVVKLFGQPDEEGVPRTPEQRYVVGLARQALGDGAAAAQDFREALWGGAGDPQLAGRALEKLQDVQVGGRALYKEAERKAASREVARLLRAAPEGLARALLDVEGKLPPGQLVQEVRFARGMALLALGTAAGAEAAFVEVSRATSVDAVVRARARLRAGDAARAQNRFRAALEHYQAASGSSAPADAEAALFGVSDMASRITRYDDARQALQDLLVRNPLTRGRPRALWGLGWIDYRAGNLPGARNFLRSLIEEGVRGGVGGGEPRALYWWGRASERMGDAADAQRTYERVIDEYPVSYYAGLAEKRLLGMERATDPWPHSMVRPAGESPGCPGPAPGRGALPGATDGQLLKARELVRLGLTGEARAALDGFGQKVIPTSMDEDVFTASSAPRAADMEEAVALNEQLGRGKEAFTLRQLQVEGYLPARSMDVLTDFLRRSHPRKFAPLIESHAQKQGVSPLLMYALTRIESRFRPDAVSRADAHGLMQLIPETATALAEDVGMPPPSRAQLHLPEVNVRLGTVYVKRLLRKFGGEPSYALAAYNAGAGAVERWQKERGTGQVDEFVEEIPFDETRLYVKKVLASYRIYERLYGDPARRGGEPGPT
ncbi:MAG: transglycosylase SLT domain-containing protein [Deltaproteobacteria bacterium]|nr:transglycosylase SLT domain-containing protein [Deltaproteobacteria bacterium]